jgi:hypothetical protein
MGCLLLLLVNIPIAFLIAWIILKDVRADRSTEAFLLGVACLTVALATLETAEFELYGIDEKLGAVIVATLLVFPAVVLIGVAR